jgi:hypothetical protein
MKCKFLFFSVLIFIALYIPASYSQTFTLTLTNDVYASPTTYEFDIYLIRTGTTTWKLSAVQFDISFNTAILGTGSLTAVELYTLNAGAGYDANNAENFDVYDPASWSPHTISYTDETAKSTLDWYEPMNAGVFGGELHIITKAIGDLASAKNVLSTDNGWCLGRIRLTNSVPFTGDHANLQFVLTGYNTLIAAFFGGAPTPAILPLENGQYVTSGLVNPVLPVELTSFVTNVSGRQVNLSWETKTEVNSRQFEIERALVSKKDATVTWASVGNVQASGTSTAARKYSYTDKNLQAGKYQYRLKMIDNDGSSKLSAVVETEIALPKSFQLSQNYPNPFNPSTRINYSLPFDSRVTLEVYNITGERIGQIVNEEQSAGYYTVNFSSSALNRSIASGVYIYKINAVDNATGNVFTSIKKMMLLK